MPDPLKLAEAIDRFGVKAITGRDVLTVGEFYKIRYCEYVTWAYKDRQASANWAEWVSANSHAAAILNEAERLSNG